MRPWHTVCMSLNQHLISSYYNIFLLPHAINPRTSHLWRRGCSCCDLLRRGEYTMQHPWPTAAIALGTSSQPGLPPCHTWAQEDKQILALQSLGLQRVSQSSSHYWVSFSFCAFLSQMRLFPEPCLVSQKTKPGTGSRIWKQETTGPSYLH